MSEISDDTAGAPRASRRHRRDLLLAVPVIALALVGVTLISHSPSRGGAAPLATAPANSELTLNPVAAGGGPGVYIPTGKPTALLFLTSQGCASCETQASTLDKVATRTGDRAMLVGIEMDPTVNEADLKAFSQSLGGLHFPLAVDTGSDLQRRFHAETLGTVIVLDRQGRVVFRGVDPSATSVSAALRTAGLV